MSNGSALAIGTSVRLAKQIGPWPAGARARVIPNLIKTIPYSEVNSTGERKEFTNTMAESVWIVMVNEFGLQGLAKFAVDLSELEVVGK